MRSPSRIHTRPSRALEALTLRSLTLLLFISMQVGCGADSGEAVDVPPEAGAGLVEGGIVSEGGDPDGGESLDTGPLPDTDPVPDAGQPESGDADSAVPDGSTPPSSDLFLNPFNKDSAHHRPIGASAEYGIPGGAEFKSFKPSDPVYTAPGPLNDRSELAARIGQFVVGKSNQGRKWIYRVGGSDPDHTIAISGDASVTIKMPAGDTAKGGNEPFYPPMPPAGGDFTVGFYSHNGGTDDLLDMFTDFDYDGRKASAYGSYPLAGLDTGEQPGYYKSAAHLRWPGTVLRGHEINPTSPGPILHALNCTATRKNLPYSTHILNRQVVWPAWGVDSTANENSSKFDPAHNHGFLPYGTRLAIRLEDREEVLSLIPATNKRGRAIVDALTFFGVFVVDGHGEPSANDPAKGKLQLRIDGLVGKNPNGTDVPGVIDEINEALGMSLTYLYPMRNPRPHNSDGDECEANDLCYAGGGGPLDPTHPEQSKNTAYDALAPGY